MSSVHGHGLFSGNMLHEYPWQV